MLDVRVDIEFARIKLVGQQTHKALVCEFYNYTPEGHDYEPKRIKSSCLPNCLIDFMLRSFMAREIVAGETLKYADRYLQLKVSRFHRPKLRAKPIRFLVRTERRKRLPRVACVRAIRGCNRCGRKKELLKDLIA